jgi:hypothetical protein
MEKKPDVKTYFEVPILESTTWGMMEYSLFALESVYSTVLPFIGGMLFYRSMSWYWILFMILPIYFRLNLTKKDNKGITKFFYSFRKIKK